MGTVEVRPDMRTRDMEMCGWDIVCVWTDVVMIQHLGTLEQVPGLDDRKRCEQIVGRINRKMAT